jgi:hypothetical protein
MTQYVMTGSDPSTGRVAYTTLPEVAIMIAPDLPPPPPSEAAWGSITGTLANQNDLQDALDAKSDFSGAYNDLTGKPALFDGIYASLTGKPALFDGVYNSLTGKPALFDGAYASLSGKPTLGTAAAAATGDFATAAQGTKADTALQNGALYATAAQGVKADSAVQPAGLTKAAVGLANADNTSDAGKPVSTATQTALNLKAPLVSPSFTTPNVGVAAGTSLAVTGVVSSSGGGIGYVAGAGGAVTQQTNKSTGVTLNKLCGQITMNGAALAAAAEVSFVVTNSTVVATDVPQVAIQSVGTVGSYSPWVSAVANGSFTISISNTSGGSLSQALVLNFIVHKSVAS